MMVKMIDPKPRERIGDLAGGTGGFLVNAHQHILERATSAGILEYDEEGNPHHLIGDQLSGPERAFMSSPKYLRGFDNDSGMTILRIGSMNLTLHGIESPQFFYRDTLSKSFDDERDATRDVILMNPPFKGAVDKSTIHPTLPADTTKSELLFLHLILRALDMGGRAAVIVPDGVLPKGVRLARTLRFANASSKRIDSTGWSRCLRACSSRTRESARRFYFLRAARRPKTSGSTIWSMTVFRWTISGRLFRKMTSPMCWNVGRSGLTRSS